MTREPIPAGQMADWAEETAKTLSAAETVAGKAAAAALRQALRKLSAPEKTGGESPRSRWLRDNWYLLQRAGERAAAALSRGKGLPGSGGIPALVTLCRRCAAVSGGEMDEARLSALLEGAGRVRGFSEREVSLVISAVTASLVEYAAEQTEDGDGTRTGNAVTGLRFLEGFDAAELLEGASAAERILRQEPAGVYPRMDRESRLRYRRRISALAEARGCGEAEAAAEAVKAASERGCHVGQVLFPERKAPILPYLGALAAVTLALAAGAGLVLESVPAALLLSLPLSSLAKGWLDGWLLRHVPPDRLPRLDLSRGVPPSGRTLCVICAVVGSREEAKRLARQLEACRLRNRDAGPELRFGLLADLPEADTAETAADAPVLDSLRREIRDLNVRWGGGFTLYLRNRSLSADSGRHMGRERKRGALLGLMRLLRDKNTETFCAEGSLPSHVRYVITLDADTRLSPGSAAKLIGTAMHPLNAAETENGRVCRGFGVLQPRITTDLQAASETGFTRLFAAGGGRDPYGGAASDLYQDVFGAGSFSGKGLLNVDAVLSVLDGAFPRERVLSHDLPEGEYLRCGYVSDVELGDGCPKTVLSWYGRLHRWVRGDWQNLPWLGKRTENRQGESVPNPVGPVGKWKILDNLRRSLCPGAVLLCLGAGLLSGTAPLLWAGVIAAAVHVREGGLLRRRSLRSLLRGTDGLGARLLRAGTRLMLLPYEAWICIHGALCALWRMFRTRRDLLQWVTAADAGRAKDGAGTGTFYAAMWPCAVTGLLFLLLAPGIPGKAAGLLWLLAPAAARRLSRKRQGRRPLGERDRLWLLRQAADQWRYFQELVTPEDHDLPPDHLQEQPTGELAHRTSPTNIGLALLAGACAWELKLASRETAVAYVRRILTAAEGLEKKNGHLYNWYDTRTGKPLSPRSVSTVDSGNLCCALIALEGWLREAEEPGLAGRARALSDAMNFSWLYDRKKALLYIGWDCEADRPTPGWYDLLSSEARAASYLAAARGDVPLRHWEALGRTYTALGTRAGLISWTGTMFEYLMPELLLPSCEGSLLGESRAFCLYAQKRRVPRELPWGISESAYYAFDRALGYRYKANGVQALALKQGMDGDLVAAPYASFLAMTVSPEEAVRNLRRLEAMGCTGKYGFYDAVDFTPERRGSAPFRVVRTWMVHHVGMSLCAAVNVLREDRLVRWFTRDPAMDAYRELLEEKPAADPAVLRQPETRVPETPRLQQVAGWQRESEPAPMLPRCTLLSNGAYTVVFCSTGQSLSRIAGIDLTDFDGEVMGEAPGIRLQLETENGLRPIAPVYGNEAGLSARAELSCEAGALLTEGEEADVCFTARVPEAEPGELREAEIRAKTGVLRGTLVWSLRPVLTERREYAAHPAFSRLMLTGTPVPGGVMIRRRGRGGRADVYLCVLTDRAFTADLERHRTPEPPVCRRGCMPDACITLHVPVEVYPRAPLKTRLALAASEDPKQAAETAKRILLGERPGGRSFPEWEAARLGMDGGELAGAMEGLGELLFSPGRLTEELAPREGLQGLWAMGVSGDLPVLCEDTGGAERLPRGKTMIRRHGLYTACGLENDLVLLTGDGGDYRSPGAGELCRYLSQVGMEGQLGARGGVHLADASLPGAAAAKRLLLPVRLPGGVRPRPMELRGGEDRPVEVSWEADGTFAFTVRGRLPHAVWSCPLAGAGMGYLAADTGMGHLWLQNAREQQISPWCNDPAGIRGPETLELETSEGTVSLFAGADGFPCRVRFGFGWAGWEKEIGAVRSRVTVFVHPRRGLRLMRAELFGAPAGAVLRWCMRLVPGNSDGGRMLRTWTEDGAFCAARAGEAAGETVRFCATVPWKRCCGVWTDWLSRREDPRTGAGMQACAGFVFPGETVTLAVGTEDGAALRHAAEQFDVLLEETLAHRRALTESLLLSTGDRRLDRYLNGWALYQTAVCRMEARTSVYQCGGAFGFRDQLQDACALIPWAPETAKQHILRAASRQFSQGDVMHWWHEDPAGPRGVRTRCSDDLLWLPYALCRWGEETGEWEIFRETAPFLSAPPLGPEEEERYAPAAEGTGGTLLEHGRRAVLQVLSRGRGPHGLLLMGSGDWNDGMNGVRGESTWLTWFAVIVMEKLGAALCRFGSREEGEGLKKAAARLRQAAEDTWTGDRYLRGYYADGTPLGAPGAEECAVDSLAQSFAVFAGADPARCGTGLETALKLLYTPDDRLVRLLAPPFDDGTQRPGYLRSYAPGCRENGGQYTHGAVWLAMALLRLGRKTEGYRLLRDILPGDRQAQVYRGEPFVLAADLCAAPEWAGRAGWTWYTGAAGWYLQAAAELLGIRLREGKLTVRPALPPEIRGYRAQLRIFGRVYRIRVENRPNSQ